jgi:hypothetical protein
VQQRQLGAQLANIVPPKSPAPTAQVRKVNNGFVITVGDKTYVAGNLDELGEVLKLAFVNEAIDSS